MFLVFERFTANHKSRSCSFSPEQTWSWFGDGRGGQVAGQEEYERAVLQHKDGMLGDAERGYRALLERLPDHPPITRNLGLLLVQTGRAGEAWPYLKVAVKAFNQDAQVLQAFSQAALAAKRPDRALTALAKAVALLPEDGDLRRTLGRLCIKQQEFAKAITHFTQVINLSPTPVPSDLVYLGDAHWAIDQISKAAEAYARAVQEDEAHLDGQLKLIRCLEFLNRLDDAETHLKIVLERAPDHVEGLFWRGCLLARRRNDVQALHLLKSIEPGDLPGSLTVRYWFERGRSADKNLIPEEAMASFTTGNALWSERYAPLMNLKRNFTDTIVAETKAIKNSKDRGLGVAEETALNQSRLGFLVGVPRSGTTLLNQVLSGHSDVCVLEEQAHVENIYTQLVAMETQGTPISTEDVQSLRSAYGSSVEADGKSGSKKLLIDKFPLNLVYIRLLRLLWPDAPIIFAMRHPYDICLSNFMQEYRFNPAMAHFSTLEETVSTYAKVMNFWDQAGRHIDLAAHTLRYEDLVTDPEPVARRLFDYLDLPWQDQVLDTHITALSRGAIATPSYRQVSEPIHTDAVARWKRYQPWIAPYLEILDPIAKANGYSVEK